MRKTILSVTAAAVLSLSACTSGAPVDAGKEGIEAANLPGDEAEQAPAEESEEVEPVDDGTSPMGKTYEFDDGLKVKVEQGGDFTPTEWAAVYEEWPTYLLFTVTIHNGTGAAVSMDEFFTEAAAEGAPGEEVFDADQGLNGPPTTRLLPGKSVTYKTGYGLMGSSDVQMDVYSTWEHDVVSFVSGGSGS